MASKDKPRSKSAAKKRARPGKVGRRRSTDIGQRKASEQGPIRAPGGRFAPGVSGNPGGRPKENDEVRELARQHTEAAIARLAYWMLSEDPKASVAASNALLDRAWGKPSQPITGKDGGPLDVNVNEVRGAIESKLARIARTFTKTADSR